MASARPHQRPTAFDRMLAPVHRWVWSDAGRRIQKLFRFGETETDGGRDILRAAEVTPDPLLRRLYLEHAIDEFRHGVMFRSRAAALLTVLPARSDPGFQADWLAPGGHGPGHASAVAVVVASLLDETFHMNYTLTQLGRVAPRRHRRHLWRARLSRLWKAYLRLATALAGILGAILLTIQYFVLLPPFAWLAKRAERRERPGWSLVSTESKGSLERQY